ncbi:hypothetical protein [Amycolatopsis sp. cmx-8-4]|uniref:hypothetical protein n=1 Tax=Amycolatopsis sp. cmx-8-4 TaxID=2790947 RepID=UPI00397C78AD
MTSPGTGSPNVLLYTGTGTTPPPATCGTVTNGTRTLRVHDVASADTGRIGTWSLTV